MTERTILTIPLSHYCEKVRWTLERFGMHYREKRYLQGLHRLTGYNLLPVMITGDDTIIGPSPIVEYLDSLVAPETSLYPRDAEKRKFAQDLEFRLEHNIGVHSRRWAYFNLLPFPAMVIRTSTQGVPVWQSALVVMWYPFLRVYMRKVLNLTPQTVDAGMDRIREMLGEIDKILSDGRPYLMGDRFTTVDLTLACMMAPLIFPPQYSIKLPNPEDFPEATQRTIREIRSSRAGMHALEMFERERRCMNVVRVRPSTVLDRATKLAEY